MSFRVILNGAEPSGRVLALLCARTGKTIEMIRKRLSSTGGLVLEEALSHQQAQALAASLPDDGSVTVSVRQDIDTWMAVLVGYRPGSRGRLRSCLQRLSGLSTEEVIHFLSSIPIALKSGVDRKTAAAVKELIERDGGIIEIRPQTGGIPVKSVARKKPVAVQKRGKVPCAEPSHVSAEKRTNPPGSRSDIPPRLEETAVRSSAGEPPPVVDFTCPDRLEVPSPPVMTLPVTGTRIPHEFSFTIPASSLPPSAVSPDETDSLPPVSEEGNAIPLFLHPVQGEQGGMVADILSHTLGLTDSLARDLVSQAPSTICLFRERINALVMLRELSESGVPVSLVRSEVSSKGSGEAGSSFFSWLNGTG